MHSLFLNIVFRCVGPGDTPSSFEACLMIKTQEGGKTTLWGRYKETIVFYHLNMQRLAEVLTHQREGINNIPEGSIFLVTAVPVLC